MKSLYKEIIITANPYQQEELVALLSDYNPIGFEERENELLVYFDEQSFEMAAVEPVIHSYDFRVNTVEEKNWNQEWESNFQPVRVGSFCAVRADFHVPAEGVEHEIVITPKMSFGTGHHATTYMMMEQMQHIGLAGKTVFDFGTGTGILSILAEKLGALNIKAIDVDEWSITNAEENVLRNSCTRISVEKSSVLPGEKFDVILANINRNVILQYAEQLKTSITEGGWILLSGLMKTDEEIIMNQFRDRFNLVRRTEKDGWISLLLQVHQ